jgi:TetR/AcrR family transcriptional repressor of nem operon
MRYSKEHKAETHARIVAKAAVRLREKGVHGVGVADLMKEAGLTHGGFYAHFDSREALVIEAFSRTMDASIRNWKKIAETTPPTKRLAAMVGNYLSPAHRDAPGQGCAVPTLGGDIVRESPRTRRAFAAKIEEMVEMLGELAPGPSSAAAKREALAAMSTMVGTLLLSRIAGTGELSDEILQAGRDAVLARQPASRAKPPAEERPKRKRIAKADKSSAGR